MARRERSVKRETRIISAITCPSFKGQQAGKSIHALSRKFLDNGMMSQNSRLHIEKDLVKASVVSLFSHYEDGTNLDDYRAETLAVWSNTSTQTPVWEEV